MENFPRRVNIINPKQMRCGGMRSAGCFCLSNLLVLVRCFRNMTHAECFPFMFYFNFQKIQIHILLFMTLCSLFLILFLCVVKSVLFTCLFSGLRVFSMACHRMIFLFRYTLVVATAWLFHFMQIWNVIRSLLKNFWFSSVKENVLYVFALIHYEYFALCRRAGVCEILMFFRFILSTLTVCWCASHTTHFIKFF